MSPHPQGAGLVSAVSSGAMAIPGMTDMSPSPGAAQAGLQRGAPRHKMFSGTSWGVSVLPGASFGNCLGTSSPFGRSVDMDDYLQQLLGAKGWSLFVADCIKNMDDNLLESTHLVWREMTLFMLRRRGF